MEELKNLDMEDVVVEGGYLFDLMRRSQNCIPGMTADDRTELQQGFKKKATAHLQRPGAGPNLLNPDVFTMTFSDLGPISIPDLQHVITWTQENNVRQRCLRYLQREVTMRFNSPFELLMQTNSA